MLVLAGRAVRRRSGIRGMQRDRAAAIYLLLAIVATLEVLQPLPQTLPHIGAGLAAGRSRSPQ